MSRRAARRVAVELLYASDVRGSGVADVLAERDDVPDYTRHLVDAVAARRSEIDELLGMLSKSWPIERMSIVDRNVLRVAVLELLEGEVPPASVIDEAVTTAKRLSGEKAGSFVNGVLAAVLAQAPGGGSSPNA
jgi:transcription antitermination protein NusB